MPKRPKGVPQDARLLFHITEAAAWRAAEAVGDYRVPSLDSEGFIHLSTAAQWLRVAHTF